ncbi:hypothetical protein M3Y98_00391600 [Aphelenchoides besseyi]|nr:hypothetical protein M3Y98_00391600 [Aphelenchoides besseyi]KAI6202373.1 hypothetical protein M3Y96_00941600 [Aphelenchoides besseyi]
MFTEDINQMAEPVSSANITWIEEPAEAQNESSPESTATIVETTFYPVNTKPKTEKNQDEQNEIASVSEYSGDVNIVADVHIEPFIPKPRDPWGASSTTSDPIQTDDLLSTTSTATSAATEESRVRWNDQKLSDVTVEQKSYDNSNGITTEAQPKDIIADIPSNNSIDLQSATSIVAEEPADKKLEDKMETPVTITTNNQEQQKDFEWITVDGSNATSDQGEQIPKDEFALILDGQKTINLNGSLAPESAIEVPTLENKEPISPVNSSLKPIKEATSQSNTDVDSQTKIMDETVKVDEQNRTTDFTVDNLKSPDTQASNVQSSVPESAWITEPADGTKVSNTQVNDEKPEATPNVTKTKETSTDASEVNNKTEDTTQQTAENRRRLPEDDNKDINIDLDEYERRLIQNTREALALVDKLCQESAERQEQRRQRHSSGGTHLDLEVETFRLNSELMDEPKGCVLLPDAKLLILDLKLGLTLMDLKTKELKRCAPADDWRDVECACYMRKHNQILLVYEQKVDNNFEKYLAKFDLDLKMLSKCEAPKYIREKVVTTCHVCYVDETDCIYLAVNTPNSCFIYELNDKCRWTEVYNMRGRQVSALEKLAVVSPITELLVVESTHRHIILLGIYESGLAERALLAFCAEPAALCIDEEKNIIVFDRATNLVGVHSRIDFQRTRELTVVGRANCSLSAQNGYLALLNQAVKELRICKY